MQTMTRARVAPRSRDGEDPRAAARAKAAARVKTIRRRRMARRAFYRRARRVLWAVTVGVVAGVLMYRLAMAGVVQMLDGTGPEPTVSSPTAP
jgi:hypothetical protein